MRSRGQDGTSWWRDGEEKAFSGQDLAYGAMVAEKVLTSWAEAAVRRLS